MPERLRKKVVLADDHTMVREALARVLEESSTLDVVGQVSEGSQIVEAVESTRADCVVLDYSMPNLEASQVIDLLLRRCPEVTILVLTVHKNVHYAMRVLEAGAHGYLIKSEAVEELVKAITTVCSGGIYISPELSQEVLLQLRRPRRNRDGLGGLSQREFDVLRILGSGKSLQECSKQLKVSTSTASTYRSRIMQKLHLQTTAELIRFAMENEIVG